MALQVREEATVPSLPGFIIVVPVKVAPFRHVGIVEAHHAQALRPGAVMPLRVPEKLIVPLRLKLLLITRADEEFGAVHISPRGDADGCPNQQPIPPWG